MAASFFLYSPKIFTNLLISVLKDIIIFTANSFERLGHASANFAGQVSPQGRYCPILKRRALNYADYV